MQEQPAPQSEAELAEEVINHTTRPTKFSIKRMKALHKRIKAANKQPKDNTKVHAERRAKAKASKKAKKKNRR
jgi:hypothetical protein